MEDVTLIYIGLAVIGSLLYFSRMRKNGFNVISNLYLQQYYYNPADATVLYIKGRNRGLIARIRALLGIGSEYSMRITRQNVFIEISTMAGNIYASLPLSMINAIQAGFAKIIAFLVLGIICFLGAFGLLFAGVSVILVILALLLSGYFFYSYWRSRVIEVTVSTGEGFWGFRFYQAAPDVTIDARLIYYTVNTINDLALAAQRGENVAPPANALPYQPYQ